MRREAGGGQRGPSIQKEVLPGPCPASSPHHQSPVASFPRQVGLVGGLGNPGGRLGMWNLGGLGKLEGG